nr:caspase family protein [Pseudomonas sp. BIGb0427]
MRRGALVEPEDVILLAPRRPAAAQHWISAKTPHTDSTTPLADRGLDHEPKRWFDCRRGGSHWHSGFVEGAASGALQFARWLEEQQQFGISPSISVLTDQNDQVVEAKAIQTAARDLLAVGGLDLLILYFSGHGIVKNGADEQVLLSNVKDYPDEAINIAATALNARHIGVPHVVIISDACRNAVDPFGSLGQVSGRPAVKRGAVVGIKPGKVDIFYATEPSQTAKEYKGEGFFTKVLLEALQSPPTEICETWPSSSVPIIPTWLLEDYLYNQVPTRAQQQTPRFEQTPDIIVQARQPLFLGYASPPLVFASPPRCLAPGRWTTACPLKPEHPTLSKSRSCRFPSCFQQTSGSPAETRRYNRWPAAFSRNPRRTSAPHCLNKPASTKPTGATCSATQHSPRARPKADCASSAARPSASWWPPAKRRPMCKPMTSRASSAWRRLLRRSQSSSRSATTP